MKSIKTTCIACFLTAILFCGILSVNLYAADKYDGYPLPVTETLRGKTVILDAGHGIENSSVVGTYYESEFALSEVMLVKQNLENMGAKVHLTRTTEKDVFFYTRMSDVNILALDIVTEKYQAQLKNGNAAAQNNINELADLKAKLKTVINDNSKASDYYNTPYSTTRVISPVLKRVFEYENTPEIYENVIFISIHSNAVDNNPSVNGTTVYYMSNSFKDSRNYYTNYSNEQRKINLATYLGNAVSAAGSFINRGLELNDFYMIREHNIPGALIETAFHTNASDRAKLADLAYRKRIANAIAYAVADYFAFYKSQETITPEPVETPTPEPTPVITEEPVPFYKADLNYDGEVSAADALAVLKHAAQIELLEGRALAEADVDRSGVIDSKDALLILKYAAQLIPAENEDDYVFPTLTEHPETEAPATEDPDTETPVTEEPVTEMPEAESPDDGI